MSFIVPVRFVAASWRNRSFLKTMSVRSSDLVANIGDIFFGLESRLFLSERGESKST
jgi:hypothetical protein